MRLLITKELIEYMKTDRGGFNAESLAYLGLPWHEKTRGWKSRLVGRELRPLSHSTLVPCSRCNFFPANGGTIDGLCSRCRGGRVINEVEELRAELVAERQKSEFERKSMDGLVAKVDHLTGKYNDLLSAVTNLRTRIDSLSSCPNRRPGAIRAGLTED